MAAGAFYEHASGVFLGVDVEYTDDFRARIGTPPQDKLSDFFLTNLQLGFRTSYLTVTLFVENAADRRYFVYNDNDIAATLGSQRLIGFSLDIFLDGLV